MFFLYPLGYHRDTLTYAIAAFEQDPTYVLSATTDEAVLETVRQILDQVEPGFYATLEHPPKGQLEVRLITPDQRGNRHSMYVPPAADGSRPGIFHLNPDHLRNGNAHGLTTLVYHEACPGHHVQLCTAQERGEALPDFRRILVHEAYIEGWAKYAEVLPWIDGYNRDRHWNLSRMRNELYSTANLVLDTGIHRYGWSREHGIAFFMQQTASSRVFSEMIVDRIAAVPGQVCSYRTGMRCLLNLRQRMQDAQGADFDIRQFHGRMLNQGSLPLWLLEQQVDDALGTTTPAR